ncbi:HlyD family efflux transporter periplasmic adaptor subunit [Pedobacter ginsengisoli]|nr:HlyD family efflux transporter periplasmic adaptor subunit [Pedobacter ginsengisoli]
MFENWEDDKRRFERSEEATTFIAHKPNFLERNGIQIIVAIFIFLVSMTCFIRYPDKVVQVGYLSAEHAPVELKSKTDGILKKLLVQNNEVVKKGDIIGWLETEINYNEVLVLLKNIDKLDDDLLKDKGVEKKDFFIKKIGNFNWGELQQNYSEFISELQKYDDFYLNGFYESKINYVDKDIKIALSKNAILEKQQTLSQRELDIEKETYNVDEILNKEALVTKLDLTRSESQLISKERSYFDVSLAIINNESLVSQKRSEVMQMKHDVLQNKVQFRQAIHSLKRALIAWIDKYSISSNESGSIAFSSFLHENQVISPSKIIGYVMPVNSRFYLRIFLSQEAIGRLKENNPVEVRFNSYPYKEFGMLNGKLNYISNIALDSGFLSKVDLPGGLKTNLKHTIPYRENLKSEVIFITKDITLGQRLFDGLFKTKK